MKGLRTGGAEACSPPTKPDRTASAQTPSCEEERVAAVLDGIDVAAPTQPDCTASVPAPTPRCAEERVAVVLDGIDVAIGRSTGDESRSRCRRSTEFANAPARSPLAPASKSIDASNGS